MYPEISLLPTDFGEEGQYGRDFVAAGIGCGRIEVEGCYERPTANVYFFDSDQMTPQQIKSESHVDLINALHNEKTTIGIIRSIIRLSTQRED
jgi:hypothetical protein